MSIFSKSALAVLAGCLLFSHISCGPGASPKSGPDAAGTHQIAPDFTLADLSGASLSLSDRKGKVVIVDFWATWCPPCRKEIPHFVELQNTYGSQGLEIIGVSLDQGGVDVVKRFAEEHGMNYPVVMGNAEVATAYGGIRGIPTTFVVDRRGRIVQKYVGYRDKQVFESAIQPLL